MKGEGGEFHRSKCIYMIVLAMCFQGAASYIYNLEYTAGGVETLPASTGFLCPMICVGSQRERERGEKKGGREGGGGGSEGERGGEEEKE